MPRPFLSLVVASLAATAVLLARIAYSGQLAHAYLLWNLFLAWLPVLFAAMTRRCRRGLPGLLGFMGFGFLWLLFLPNAPYLITDLIHLGQIGSVPLWYDAVMIFFFALTGLLLGLYSLYRMHSAVSDAVDAILGLERFGRLAGWSFALAAAGLSSFGIYIGRFLRWNSWDVFVHPVRLSADVYHSLATPHLRLTALLVVVLFSAITAVAYVFLYGQHETKFRRPGGEIAPP